jgi:hypothetical protein
MIPFIETPKKRLIVILPDDLAGNLDLANKIHGIALREQREVLYLTLVDDYAKMLTKSRSMATMVAVTTGNILTVNSRLLRASDWLKTLREINQPDDVIVCQAEQSVKNGLTGVIPLGEYIRSVFKHRIIIVSGYYKPVQEQLKRIAFQVLFLVGFLVIFSLFTTLEIYLDRSLYGVPRTILLCVVVCFEFGAVYAWNNLVSR